MISLESHNFDRVDTGVYNVTRGVGRERFMDLQDRTYQDHFYSTSPVFVFQTRHIFQPGRRFMANRLEREEWSSWGTLMSVIGNIPVH